MNINRQKNEEELEVNMTPMLDIVFIMLIFFIVTAVFVKAPGVEVVRPEAQTGEDIKRVSTIIGITADNEVWINKKRVALDEVREIVSKLRLENPKGQMVIKADAESEAGLVVNVVELLNQLGVAGVAIATQAGGAI